MVGVSPPIYRGGNLKSVDEASAIHHVCINRGSASLHGNLSRASQSLFGGISIIPRVVLQDIVEPFVAARQVFGSPVVLHLSH